MSDPNLPAPGWYAAPHANGEQRYWDGAQWHPETPEQASAAAQQLASVSHTSTQTAMYPSTTAVIDQGAEPAPKKKGLKWWAWALIGLGALLLLIVIIGSLNRPAASSDADATSVSASSPPAVAAAEEPEPEPVMVEVPSLVGLTADAAAADLRGRGLEPQLTTKGDADVTGTDPAAGSAVEEGTVVTIIAVEKPTLSLSQQNAVAKAKDYLDYTSFSRTGLIGQLEYEGFATVDAEFAVDYVAPDWNAQAALKAQDYLDYTSFSRQGLIDQLIYEGFSPEQAEFGVTAVGF